MRIIYAIFPQLKKEREFKKKIEGFFSSWKMNRYYAKKNEYSLWIGNDFFSAFKDEGSSSLLSNFEDWEKKLLWKEAMKEKQLRMFVTKEEIFKEFGIE